MAFRTSAEQLQALVDALRQPAPPAGLSALAAQQMRQIAVQGWASRSTIEDLLLAMDRRLDLCCVDAPKMFTAMFDLPWRNVTYRPSRLAVDTVLHQALSAADLAQLLMHLEACGFMVDPSPLVDALTSGVRTLPVLDTSQLSVLWFERWRHKGAALTIRAMGGAAPTKLEWHATTSKGYRTQTGYCAQGNLVQLEVHAPKHRRRQEPVETCCPDCGWTWFRGDPESSAIHRRQHKARMLYLDPQPHARLMKAQEQGLDMSWVTTTSPAWQHREMYDRALAFKRELHYSFVQWGSPSGDDDPDVHGFFFVDERQAIVGSCAFRIRRNDAMQWWALQWIWISPKHRRNGHLSRHWDSFKKRFGHFEVESPVSDAMTAFLAKHGDSHFAGHLFNVLPPPTRA